MVDFAMKNLFTMLLTFMAFLIPAGFFAGGIACMFLFGKLMTGVLFWVISLTIESAFISVLDCEC